MQFSHLLEKHDLGPAMLNRANEYLQSQGIGITAGTIAVLDRLNREGHFEIGNVYWRRKRRR